MEFFNKEDIYDNEISPLMKKVNAICKEHNIPMMASFTFENSEENGIGSCDTILNPKGERYNERLTNAMMEIRKNQSKISTVVTISPK